MTIGKKLKNSLGGEFKAPNRITSVGSGEALSIIRELQNLSQHDLSKLTGIPQSTISGIENERINLDGERAKSFARVLKVSPEVLLVH